MNYFFFYLPILYSYKTRFKTISAIVSWGGIYCIPVIYITLASLGYNYLNLFISICAILLIYTLYETGYIQNDAETIKKETNPTKRLTSEDLSFYESNKLLIYSVRFMISLFLSCIIYKYIEVKLDVIIFLLTVWCLVLIYQVYNNIRNRFNLLLHFFLVLIRFCSVLLLSYSIFNWKLFFISILVFPVINLIERASEKRFRFSTINTRLDTKNNKKQLGKFRIIYYFSLLLFCSVLLLLNIITLVPFLLVCYFFMYRFLTFFLILK